MEEGNKKGIGGKGDKGKIEREEKGKGGRFSK